MYSVVYIFHSSPRGEQKKDLYRKIAFLAGWILKYWKRLALQKAK